MNKSKLKTYAPKAREEFIKAVTERAHFYGISNDTVEACTIKGDFAFIAGRAFPRKLADTRKSLLGRIEKSGFTQVMEDAAYTWFNRIAAIRFMEINGYLSHGYRVLSHPDGHKEPEILEKSQFLDNLDGFEKEEILRLKMAADKDKELYQRILVAQCNELSNAMPFLFEEVDDPTELLLPDNLLNTDSVIRQMVNEIPEEEWKEVEIIGWLYQFYISEKKASLMKAKKAYKTEDIPAVTQLFTPNWIVKYLVQNSLGAKWLAVYPASGIKAKMEYYIIPAEQSDDVKAKLKEITPTSLNPEELTVLDPACGSGHILVEAYDLLKEIYLERGYRAKDIPALILAKNIYGLEIDERAAQLAGFALMMKARQDDREIFKKNIRPNIVCIKSANGLGAHFKEAQELIKLFENAKTFGSLIRVPEGLKAKLPDIRSQIESKRKDLNRHEVWARTEHFDDLLALINQAEILSKRYDCVIANPPYMGGKGMNGTLKEFAKTQYPATKSDLFSMFIERGFEMAEDKIGYNAMVTMQSWMFLSSYEEMRQTLLDTATIRNMVHMSNGVMGIAFGTCATVWRGLKMDAYKGSFSYLEYADLNDRNVPREFPIKNDRLKDASSNDIKKIPRSPIAYWVSEMVRDVFGKAICLSEIGSPRQGLATGDNDQFRRNWTEVNYSNIGFCGYQDTKKWFPYNSGGEYRKWYGNQCYVVNWEQDGKKIRNCVDENGSQKSRPQNTGYYFKPSISWAKVTSGGLAMRYFPKGFIFDVAGCSIFIENENERKYLLGFFNSCLKEPLIASFCPTINFEVGQIANAPIIKNIDKSLKDNLVNIIHQCISFAKNDWDSLETSWEYQMSPLLVKNNNLHIEKSYEAYKAHCHNMTDQMKQLEEENNRLFIEVYGLQGEIAPGVSIEEVTLFANPKYRYKGELTDDELEVRFKADTMKELISYAVGCMMGRYSLDASGLILANTGESGEDYYRIVSEKQSRPEVASDEGQVVNNIGGNLNGKQLQRFNGMAEGDGLSGNGVSSNREFPEGGSLRIDQSGSQGSSLHPVEHSGGASQEIDSGVPKFSFNSPGFASRSRNSAADCFASKVYIPRTMGSNSVRSGRSEQDDQLSDEQTHHSPLITFPPDEDGIIPIIEREWFDDDAACRFFRFIDAAWDKKGLDENLDFIADAIGRQSGESSREAIRRYLANDFFKDHVHTYKNRPIYWLFSSGKEKAFQALVYLHRYNEGTLARMRTEYVLPLQTKISRQIEHLEKDKDAASSGSAANKISKEIIILRKQAEELIKFDELLRHYADKKIKLDLDDGVKVNYGKFGELLADVKKIAITDKDEQGVEVD